MWKLHELIYKFGRARVICVSLTLLTIVYVLLAFSLYEDYNDTSYKARPLEVREVSESGIILVDWDDNEMRMAAESPFGTASMNVDLVCLITYRNEEIRYSHHLSSGEGRTYIFSDGTVFIEPFVLASDDGQKPKNALSAVNKIEKQLVEKLLDWYLNYKTPDFFVGYALRGLFVLLMASANFIFSEDVFWLCTGIFRVDSPPKYRYIAINKFFSIILAILVFFGIHWLTFLA